jgi:poly-gamma-glutamate synthesis protein (capsule biosynthesis protein)
MSPDKISLYATGDIMPDRPNSEWLFELVLPTLKKADILFGQLECCLSQKGEPQLSAPTARDIPPDRVSALVHAGFDVMSFASNHTFDRGREAFFETLDVTKKNNLPLIGVGKDIEEARQPLILERNGTKMGFLAYCSVLPKGYEAGPDRPGCAPMRATTSYEQVDWQPGTPPQVITVANKEELAAMVDDIKKLRPKVDVLVMSIHWGVHFVPGIIAMYQKEIGHAAIDAGVDLILGHHAHILKGIEVYKGKVIFYSLCNLVMPAFQGHRTEAKAIYGIKYDAEYAEYDFSVDSRKSIIAKCTIADKKIDKVSYLPLWINKHAQPEVLTHSDKRSTEVFDYLNWCCQDQGLNAKFTREGDEVVIHT